MEHANLFETRSETMGRPFGRNSRFILFNVSYRVFQYCILKISFDKFVSFYALNNEVTAQLTP